MTRNEPTQISPIPDHLHTVTPRLVVSNGTAAIDFYRRAFGAQEVGERFKGPDAEVIHAEIRIGDSIVMVTEDSDLLSDAPAKSPEALGGSVTAVMSLYWEDVDSAWDRALRQELKSSIRWLISFMESVVDASETHSGNNG